MAEINREDRMRPDTAGLIFLGGKARRLNGLDKASLKVAGRTCFEHVIARLRPHMRLIYISVGTDYTTDSYGSCPVIRDTDAARAAGMAGVLLRCLKVMGQDPEITSVITSSVDTPFLPADYVPRLTAIAHENRPVVAVSHGIIHGLHAVWPVGCTERLEALVLAQKEYRMQAIHHALGSTRHLFEPEGFPPPSELARRKSEAPGRQNGLTGTSEKPIRSARREVSRDQAAPAQAPLRDPFFNINTPEDLKHINQK